MKKIGFAVLAVLLLAGTALADSTDTKIAIKPIAGASFGSIQRGENPGASRISYWAGAYIKSITPNIALWGVYQQTKIEDLNLTGKGGKALFTITHDTYEEWTLLLGGGWLANYALEGDGIARTTAFTLDMGVMYQWLLDQVYIGMLGSGVDYGPRFDWSIDLGAVVMF